jgi:threonine dehydratase
LIAKEFDLTVEPSGALGVLAAQQLEAQTLNGNILVSIATGGNLDPRILDVAPVDIDAATLEDEGRLF